MNIQLMKLRKAAGYSNRDAFAKEIGVNKYTYRSWESGAATMSADQLWMCAEALHCTPNDILGWYVEHPEDKAPGFEQDEIAIIENYRECTPQWRTNIAMTARSAASESKNTPKCVLSDEGKQENVA